MAAIFALLSAMLYGTADFIGGAASRRTAVLSLLLVNAPSGLAVMIAAAVFAGGPAPAAAALAWGAAGGAAGGVGLIGFYAALAAGPMSVVAPVSALMATVLPVGIALASGERPGPAVLAGSAVCLVAIALISLEPEGPAAADPDMVPRTRRGLLYGLAAGAAFGLFFVFVKNAGHAAGLWPLAVARGAGVLAIAVAAACTGTRPLRWRPDQGVFALAVVSGAVDAVANICYVLATRSGLFSLAVVLTSLYPAMTVLLARVVLGERMRGLQRAGLVLAAIGVVLATSA